MTATLGYARVSTAGQDLDAQLAALIDAGVDPQHVFTDKLSGSAKTDRPGLTAMLNYARLGDTLVVTAIDRPGRSIAEVTRRIADLGDRQIILRALREGIDTSTPTGRAVATIVATLAELELGYERRAASRQSPQVRGLPAAKPAKLTPNANNSFAACSDWKNPYTNWPKPSLSAAQPHTATSLGTRMVRTRSGETATSSSAAATAI